jgi:hypothetical protein
VLPELPIIHQKPTYLTGFENVTVVLSDPLEPKYLVRGTPIAGSLLPVLVPDALEIAHPVTVAVPTAHEVGQVPEVKELNVSVVALSVTCDPVTNGAEK